MGSPSRQLTGILPYQEILRFCDLKDADCDTHESNSGRIRPSLKRSVRTAAYDLRLGGEYYVDDRDHSRSRPLRTRALEDGESIAIARNDVVIVTVMEELDLPADIVGHLSLKMDQLLQGLIMASQSQIDAGYRGRVFALLYNLSSETVYIKRGDPLLRLELVRLAVPTDKTYEGDYRDKSLVHSLNKGIGSSLQELRAGVDAASKNLRRTQWVGGLLALVAIGFPMYQVFFGEVSDLKQRAAALEARLESGSARATGTGKMRPCKRPVMRGAAARASAANKRERC